MKEKKTCYGCYNYKPFWEEYVGGYMNYCDYQPLRRKDSYYPPCRCKHYVTKEELEIQECKYIILTYLIIFILAIVIILPFILFN